MNKEELRKEATTTVEWECIPMIDRLAELKDEVHTWKEASSANSYKAFQFEKENKELSQHILELQKDKDELVDEVKSLKAQIEKMKKYIKACWVEENLNDYSSYITNTSDEFRDLVKELNEEIRNGR